MAAKSTSSSPTLRFLGFLKQPDDSDPTNIDLHENDVVWSFLDSSSTSPAPPPLRSHRRVTPIRSGLSDALGDAKLNVTIPKSKEIENIPARFHQSAPVNIPVWPKKFHHKFDEIEEEVVEEREDDEIVPPHVIVARSHLNFSVFEGVGRTLKGRDLRSVRNAVFRKTGFLETNF